MASPRNRHCANCIGTLSFPIKNKNIGRKRTLRTPASGGSVQVVSVESSWVELLQCERNINRPTELQVTYLPH